MKYSLFRNIEEVYKKGTQDSTDLFSTILEISKTTGIETALKYLEICVSNKRRTWIERNQGFIIKTGNIVLDGFRLFYEDYLHLSIPNDGEIVNRTDTRIVMRWWNECPTLNSCIKFGLDTCYVCRVAYHQPVEVILNAIDPRLRFNRNYKCIRPHSSFCEEIIELK